MQKKSIKLWVWLLVSPFITFVLIAVLQLITKLIFGGSGTVNAFVTLINLFTVLLGMLAMLLLLFGTPVWIVMIVVTLSKNKTASAPTPVTPSQPVQPQDPNIPTLPPTYPPHQ